MYNYKARVRYSELSPDGCLSPLKLLDYLQDVATFHSEDEGVGLAYLKERNAFWALNAWQIEIMRMPNFGEEITINTIPYEIKGFIGSRNFEVVNAEGEVLSVANSVWTLFNTEKQRPEMVPPELKKIFGNEEKIDMEYLGRKVNPRPDMECTVMPEFQVAKHHLDTNNHVNNGQYVYMAWDYINGFNIKRLRVEYRTQAFLGDVFIPHVYKADNIILVSFENAEGKVYANVEFTY